MSRVQLLPQHRACHSPRMNSVMLALLPFGEISNAMKTPLMNGCRSTAEARAARRDVASQAKCFQRSLEVEIPNPPRTSLPNYQRTQDDGQVHFTGGEEVLL